jgi:hypothetical protein
MYHTFLHMNRLQTPSPNWLGEEYLSSCEGVLMTTTKTKFEYFRARLVLMKNASLDEREC